MPSCNEPTEEDRRAQALRLWLGSGALTLGMGAAMLGGAAIAGADTDSGSSDGASSSSSAGSDSSNKASGPGAGKKAPMTARSVRSASSSGAELRGRLAVADEVDAADAADSGEELEERAGRESETAAGKGDPDAVSGQDDVTAVTEPTSSDAPAVSEPNRADAPVVNVAVPSAATPDADGRDAEAIEPAPATPTLTAAAIAAPAAYAWAPPTPNQILRTLQQFGRDLHATLVHQIRGAQRNLSVLGADLTRMFGIQRVVYIEPAPYGNPLANQQYWAQQQYGSHTLATVAMAWAQLTGTQVDVQDFLDLAMDEDSLYSNFKVYDPSTNRFVTYQDSYEVLQGKGVRIFTNYFARGEDSHALHALATGLQDPTKAMIVTIAGAADGITGPAYKSVVVLGVDTETETVIYNDPTRAAGQGASMSVDDFLAAWRPANFSLVTAQLAATAGVVPTIPGAQKTRLVWNLPRPDKLGVVLRNLGTMVAETVVNQIDGVQRNLVDLSDDLARTFGVASLVHAEPPAPGDIEFGNYNANKPYWIYQGQMQSCAIMSSAGIIGQLTGVMPTQQEILELAWSTPSDVYPGQAVFEGDGDVPGKHWGTNSVDVLKLLNLKNIDADATTFLKSQGQLALETMTAALADNQGVLVSVNSDLVYKAFENTYVTPEAYRRPPGTLTSNHMVIVLSVNTTKNVVYLNDSASTAGQGMPVPLDKFLDAWQTGGHNLITAQLRAV